MNQLIDLINECGRWLSVSKHNAEAGKLVETSDALEEVIKKAQEALDEIA